MTRLATGAVALQLFSQLARFLPQQFSRLWDAASKFINAVKDFACLSIFARATDDCVNALPEFAREPRHAGRRFPLERLSIQTSLACDDKIDIFHSRFQTDCFGNHIEAWSNFRAGKTHQT